MYSWILTEGNRLYSGILRRRSRLYCEIFRRHGMDRLYSEMIFRPGDQLYSGIFRPASLLSSGTHSDQGVGCGSRHSKKRTGCIFGYYGREHGSSWEYTSLPAPRFLCKPASHFAKGAHLECATLQHYAAENTAPGAAGADSLWRS
jgi:hypothetical protein